MNTLEQWKQIEGFPYYEVSNYGNVRSWMKSINEPRIIKQQKSTRGYMTVAIRIDRKVPQVVFKVHRLVVHYFSDTNIASYHVDHIDEDKTNNHIANLRICDVHENNEFYNSKDNRENNTSLPVIVNGARFESIREAAKYVKININRDVKTETIRREIAAIARGQCKPRNMYKMFMIEPI